MNNFLTKQTYLPFIGVIIIVVFAVQIFSATLEGTIKAASDSSTIESAKLVLYQREGSGSNYTIKKLKETISNNEGKYEISEIDNVSRGMLHVVKEGYAPTVKKWITLSGAATKTENVFLELPEEGFGNISGTVKDNLSTPLPNVDILLKLKAKMGGSTLFDYATTKTDSDGKYSFDNIPIMELVELIASATGFTSSSNDTFSLDTAQVSIVDFVLKRGNVGIIDNNLSKQISENVFTSLMKNNTLIIQTSNLQMQPYLSLYTINGKQIISRPIKKSIEKINIMPIINNQVLILYITAGNNSITKKFVIQ